ncbi:tetratricopeptide repeat protein [Roseofilum sp. BLCC_M154]|uniref:Tetratricopeptide repeat protein n=1 Tax=Roseofilum acuticapitatum BLCC-M154 TaxID=3022444 RepID=A0ABT7ALX1_9CYAN|nr:hypothetical protein [Roseofilum acuticapitatum]MDJ1167894.1 tetratricopeptide repeat protein [Roseofilum acuticapitatum BLCC-M154]
MTNLQRCFAIFGALAFFGSTALATTRLFRTPPRPNPSSETETLTVEDQLLSQERGYLTVLEREPKNKVALEGLIMVRLQMNNLEGVVKPLETLIEVAPEDTTYKTLYEELQQQLNTTQPDELSTSPTDESP